MAHFAEIDENNVVLRVLVVPNDEEHRGQEFLAQDLNLGGTWLQTSYNDNMRKQYAGVGYTYDSVADEFVTPQPYPSWTLNADNDWVPPVARPEGEDVIPDGPVWTIWDEEKQNWRDALSGALYGEEGE